MVKAHLQAVIDGDLKTVWQIVIDNEHYAWWSDLQKIIVADDGQSFTELSKNGMETHFVITVQEYCSRYEFTLENSNLRGHWQGLFSATTGGTRLELIEELEVKKPLLRLVAGKYLRHAQQRYLADLRREVERQNVAKSK